MMKQRLLLPLLALLPGCLILPDTSATRANLGSSPPEAEDSFADWKPVQPDLAISQPPFREVHANWKQRLDQPYVYVEYTGSYVETGRLLPMIHQALMDQGVRPAGAPFALFYDDPGMVPVEDLRSRACVPVESAIQPPEGLSFDVLPSTTVVYAFAGGAYPEVPRAYPGLLRYMRGMGWVENGPIRETYLVPPGAVEDFSELVTEVQIPVTFAR